MGSRQNGIDHWNKQAERPTGPTAPSEEIDLICPTCHEMVPDSVVRAALATPDAPPDALREALEEIDRKLNQVMTPDMEIRLTREAGEIARRALEGEG